MSQAICKYPFAYPHNLVCEVYGTEVQRDELPPDIDDSVEYVLETKIDERNAFILILRYLRRMSIREIAAYYGLSCQGITQIIQKSLRRLRTPDCSKYLRLGCAAVKRQEEQQAGMQQRAPELPKDMYFGSPLQDIPDDYERIDTMLLRGGLNPIKWLGLSTRAYNCVQRSQIEYVWQLCFLTPQEILWMKNAGERTLEEIEEKLDMHGLSLESGMWNVKPELRSYAEQECSILEELVAGRAV